MTTELVGVSGGQVQRPMIDDPFGEARRPPPPFSLDAWGGTSEGSAPAGGGSSAGVSGVVLVGEIAEMIHSAGAAGLAVGASFFLGVGAGLAINAGYTAATGGTIGGDIYTATHH